MKILLISPMVDPEMRREKGMAIPQLSLYILEGLTPKEHSVQIIEEEADELDLDQDCDLVGISCMTSNAPRAYKISAEFRKRGKTVVMGGIHPTILPDEALEHASCVVIGEAEGVWEKLLEDHSNDRLQKTYQVSEPDLTRYIPKNFHKNERKRIFNAYPVLTTKGCPYDCDFCSVAKLYGNKVRHYPVENVVRDIRESGGKAFIFLDDNVVGHPNYAKELFRALIPLKIKWAGMASVKLAKDDELLRLCAESGCKALLIGVESIEEEQMATLNKSFKRVEELEWAIQKIMKAGIIFHASMIYGFDYETRETVLKTVKFLQKQQVSTASFCVLTPFPGTRTYEQMKRDNRLISQDWKFYNNRTTIFTPRNLSPLELQSEYMKAKKTFYNTPAVLKRWPANRRNSFLHFASNVAYVKQTRSEALRFEKLKREVYHSERIQTS